jgi:hypothetical protein
MELSALALGPADGVDLRVDTTAHGLFEAAGTDALEPVCPSSVYAETVVVHVQLRPRRSSTRRCLAALAALGDRHDVVPFALTGLSGDDRVVRVTVGVDLGPRELIAKFSDQAQAAYAFVDALFTDLYDYMPVYVGEPSAAERTAAAGVLEAAAGVREPAEGSRPRTPAPRIPSPRAPMDLGSAAPAARRGVPAFA